MPLLLIRDDITKVHADAIVNPANQALLEGPGTSRAVFLAAGESLLKEACAKAGGCEVGKAVITDGFGLPARYIIHAVGPVWQGGGQGEDEILYATYMESMKLARRWRLESIAFPLLSSGSCRYPKDRALSVAVSAISDFLMENEMLVYLVVYDSSSLAVSRKLFASIEEYIDQHYVQKNDESFGGRPNMPCMLPGAAKGKEGPKRSLFARGRREKTSKPSTPPPASYAMPMSSAAFLSASPEEKTRQLEDIMLNMGETFSQMLLRLIDERGISDPEVYHKANIDRKLFSKIRTNVNYSPNKKTVLSFAIALELSLDETKDLLGTAGYSLSNSSRFDVIVSFFLEHGIYDIFEINEMLFYYEQPILG